MKQLQIAIDGPVASGKGDIAARLAAQLHLVYIYTGAMYRALAVACIERSIPFQDTQRVITLCKNISIDFQEPEKGSNRTFVVFLNGIDITERIIEQDAAMGASDVSVIPEVRVMMVERQQQIAEGKRVVMEGRDIGFRVLPHAQLKIYLTASLEERAKRRYLQWKEKGIQRTLEETTEDTKKRDYQDTHRAADPLQKLPDAWELDTTDLTQEEVVGKIIDTLRDRSLL